jgi:WD40 repeat protein
VVTLRLVSVLESEKHSGEVFACAYSPDGGFVLSGGWDGHLRLWEASSGNHLTALRVGPKPLSACAFTPDGRRWGAGSMEGVLSFWDAQSHMLLSQSLTHTRPVSCVLFSPDGKWLASTSWDRQVALRCLASERDSRTFTAHDDIVNGCRFSPDGSLLLTWSHDRSLRLWDPQTGKEVSAWKDHTDRITSADLSPDGSLAASGSRNGELILWDVEARAKLNALKAGEEVRGCFFLLDGVSLLTLDAKGRLMQYSVPDLQLQGQLALQSPVQCGALSPSGSQLAVGGEDGRVRFVAIEGCEGQPLVVTASETSRRTASRFQSLFGRSSVVKVYACVCPACRHSAEFLDLLPSAPAPCPHCRRPLRFNRKTLAGQPT